MDRQPEQLLQCLRLPVQLFQCLLQTKHRCTQVEEYGVLDSTHVQSVHTRLLLLELCYLCCLLSPLTLATNIPTLTLWRIFWRQAVLTLVTTDLHSKCDCIATHQVQAQCMGLQSLNKPT